METILSEGFRLLGVYAVTLIILCFGVVYLYKYIQKLNEQHLREREEWRQVTQKQFEKMNEVFVENTSVLEKIKTLLEVTIGKNI